MSWRASLSRYVHEVRIHLCQHSGSSAAAREFVFRNYKDLKMLNPRLPILIRECSGVQPRLFARYDYGVEQSVPLTGLSEEQICAKLKELADVGKSQAAQ